MLKTLDQLKHSVEELPTVKHMGKVLSLRGLLIECSGLESWVSIGSRCKIYKRSGETIHAEVVGFKQGVTLLMPFNEIEGIGIGCEVEMDEDANVISPHESWLGRVVNALGKPVDNKGMLLKGDKPYHVKSLPPPAHERRRVNKVIDLGVKAINNFVTCCKGQRMGVFSGSGVGKSVLVSMLTKYAESDVKVIGLIGERGREVQEFLHEYLGEEGLRNAIVVVATGDESALMRRQAAWLTLTIAEYFRDQGKDVLCLMDSITRFAMAQREIGLSIGEPPTTKGYPPTVFAELPKLLERAGPGKGEQGDITGLFSVLIEGDDHNEPISDAVRGILDGHIVLSRTIAERGRFPAVDIVKSVSRTMPGCHDETNQQLIKRARRLLSRYNDMEELIRIGAYKKGADSELDEAIHYAQALENFLHQPANEKSNIDDGFNQLNAILNG